MDEITSWIGEHLVEDADATEMIREMREKNYSIKGNNFTWLPISTF